MKEIERAIYTYILVNLQAVKPLQLLYMKLSTASGWWAMK